MWSQHRTQFFATPTSRPRYHVMSADQPQGTLGPKSILVNPKHQANLNFGLSSTTFCHRY